MFRGKVNIVWDLDSPDSPKGGGGVATDESVNEEAHRRTGRSKSELVYMLHSAKNIDSAMQTMLTDWLICMTRECF